MKHIFIINPRAGKEKENISVRVREYVASRPELGALVFNTEYVGHETVLVQRLCHIFEDEMIRLYVCGGSGTLCRAISGISNYSLVEVAFYPCGMTNDILKVFEGEVEPFFNLNSLVNGTPMYLDIFDFGFGRCVNFCGTGYAAKVASDVNSLARWNIGGTTAPYYLSIIRNTISLLSSHYFITVDGNDMSGHKTLISLFNGIVFGGSFSPIPRACPVNAKMKLLMYEAPSFLSVIPNLRHFKNGDLAALGKNVQVKDCSEIHVKMPDSRRMYFSADGESFDMSKYKNEFTVRVLPATLKFVVPAGVALKEQCREGE